MLIHTHDYDSSYYPAMPVVVVELRRRAGSASIILKAIVDSGADATMVPLRYLRRLKVRKEHTRWLSGITGGRYEVDLYTVAVQIGAYRPIYVEAVGTEQSDEVILGRDVLNQFAVTLNAPAYRVVIAES